MTFKPQLETTPKGGTKYPPPHLLQRIANNANPADFLKSFPFLRAAVKNYLEKAGLQFSQFKDILDFGCGVGRFAFAFKEELSPGQRLWGCDVYEECAQWCRDNIDFAETQHTSVEPPLPYASGQFDLVYALSVFTHLGIDQQFTWAWELHRILRPGGVVFATTHGKLFIPMLYQSYLDSAQMRTLHSLGEDGLFAYMSYSGDPKDAGQVNVAAAQTTEFVKQQFSAFDLVGFFPQSNLAGEQDLYIFRKPESARPIAKPLASNNDSPTKCSWIGQVGDAADSGPVSLRFHLEGHRWFRAYPRMLVQAALPLDCEVEIQDTNGVLLLNSRVPLNNQRVFGPSHYAVVEIQVPEYNGDVIVSLRCPVRESSEKKPDAMEVEWNFPNFV